MDEKDDIRNQTLRMIASFYYKPYLAIELPLILSLLKFGVMLAINEK